MNRQGRLFALKKFSKESPKELRADWEGYHLLEYSTEVRARVGDAEFIRAVKKNTNYDAFDWIQKIPTEKTVGLTKAKTLFTVLKDAQKISLLPCLLKFLEFCERENRQLAAFEYKEAGLLSALEDIRGYLDSFSQEGEKTLPNKDLFYSVKKSARNEIVDASHYKLCPVEMEIIGRDKEISAIVDILNSSVNCAHVVGVAGIGKTEVCKAALKAWLDTGDASRVFWVQTSNSNNVSYLIEQIGAAVGLSGEVLSTISDFSQLRNFLPNALYYLVPARKLR